MREIEVRYRVADPASLLLALVARGIQFGEPVHQDDQAYAPIGWSFGDEKVGISFLFLRTVGSRHFFVLKKPTGNARTCLEYETEIVDREQMHQAILWMEFGPTVRVVKTRRTAVLDDISFHLDYLEGIGTFLEIERLVPGDGDGSAGRVQDELAEFVAALGVDVTRAAETYESLVRNAGNGRG
ncbi:CYTH domain-containing protein [Frankia sp. Cppng1_Ct_nod]|uniref:class IV adenylate cyclase n=1 Tax=Frankia sp. Cppng1_Ct_nod TaxID=2897162 RepID=UPI0010411208|nr:CYTH domain-containing protein [Frankia sp. Cppng1_Ct_nod]